MGTRNRCWSGREREARRCVDDACGSFSLDRTSCRDRACRTGDMCICAPTRPAGGCMSSRGFPSCESARSSFGRGRGPRWRTSPCRPKSFPFQSCRTGCSGPASRTFRSCTSSHWPASLPYPRPAASTRLLVSLRMLQTTTQHARV
jgi:hypothetical protein